LAARRELPPHVLSQEAVQRRQERLEADKIKDKSKKKTDSSTAANSRKGSAPAANSVAAKRLAAKRGQVLESANGAASEIISTERSGAFEANFIDSFESIGLQSAPPNTENSTSWEFSNGELDFGSAVAESNFWDSGSSWPQGKNELDDYPICNYLL
jgi:hypothetical protein